MLNKLDQTIQNIKNNIVTSVPLGFNKLGAEGGKAIAEALKNNNRVTSVDLQFNDLGTEGGKAIAEALKNNNTITSIDLGNNTLGAEGGIAVAEALKNNNTITSLNLGSNALRAEGGKAIAEALKNNNTITSIDLGSNDLEAEGGKAIAEALKNNNTITSIDLGWNNLGAEGGKAIAEALKNNNTITLLNLEFNNLGAEEGKAIAEALKYNNTITSIDFRNNTLGAEGGKAIAEALKNNYTITSVDLSSNDLGAEGGKVVAEVLKHNNIITSLGLGFNHLGDEGGRAVAEALKNNYTVTSVNLRGNHLRAEGVKAIAEALKYNNTITSIDLQYSDLGAEGGRAIAEALKNNNTITSLNFRNNNLGAEGGRAIAEALKHNNTITYVELEGPHFSLFEDTNNNSVSDEVKATINEITKRNEELFQANINNIKQGKELDLVSFSSFLGILKHKISNTSNVNLKEEYQSIQTIMEKRISRFSHPDISNNLTTGDSSLPTIPEEFRCPITNQIMMEPVLIDSGETYEREAIEKWLEKNNTDPLTNIQLFNKNFVTNRSVKRSIVSFLENHPFSQYPELWEEVYIPKQFTQQLLAAMAPWKENEIKRLIEQAPHILMQPIIGQQTLLELIVEQDNVKLLEWSIKQLGDQFWHHPLVVKENGAECFRSMASQGRIGMAQVWGQALKWDKVDYQIELWKALEDNNIKMLEVCIASGADVNEANIKRELPIHYAIGLGDTALVEVLLQSRADINKTDNKGESPLHKAVSSGNLEMTKKVLSSKPNLEIRNKEGFTALELALKNQQYDIVESLINSGANIVGLDKEGNPILINFVSQGEERVVGRILSSINITEALEVKNKEGRTALLQATVLGREAIVSILVEKGANIEAKDKDGNTSLHIAVSNGHKELISDLLQHNAYAKALNNANLTPTMLARSMGQTALANFVDEEKNRIKLEPFIAPLRKQISMLQRTVQDQQEQIQDQQKKIESLESKVKTWGGREERQVQVSEESEQLRQSPSIFDFTSTPFNLEPTSLITPPEASPFASQNAFATFNLGAAPQTTVRRVFGAARRRGGH